MKKCRIPLIFVFGLVGLGFVGAIILWITSQNEISENASYKKYAKPFAQFADSVDRGREEFTVENRNLESREISSLQSTSDREVGIEAYTRRRESILLNRELQRKKFDRFKTSFSLQHNQERLRLLKGLVAIRTVDFPTEFGLNVVGTESSYSLIDISNEQETPKDLTFHLVLVNEKDGSLRIATGNFIVKLREDNTSKITADSHQLEIVENYSDGQLAILTPKENKSEEDLLKALTALRKDARVASANLELIRTDIRKK